jgi:hypothetical protein
VCCISERGESQCRAATSCGTELHLACSDSNDCASNQVCCAQGEDPFALRPTKCQKQCAASTTTNTTPPSQVCSDSGECPANTDCFQSWALPATGLCFRSGGPPGPIPVP